MKPEIPKVNHPKAAAPLPQMRPGPVKRPTMPALPRADTGSLSTLRAGAMTVHQIRLAAQRELDIARKTREDANRYQQEMAARARSDTQQLMLKVRLATQKEIEQLVHHANEEIQKVLADIRMIRIMAQEELAAQRKFTDAARLRSMSLNIPLDEEPKPEPRKKKTLAAVK